MNYRVALTRLKSALLAGLEIRETPESIKPPTTPLQCADILPETAVEKTIHPKPFVKQYAHLVPFSLILPLPFYLLTYVPLHLLLRLVRSVEDPGFEEGPDSRFLLTKRFCLEGGNALPRDGDGVPWKDRKKHA